MLKPVFGSVLLCLSGCGSEFTADNARARIVFQVDVDETAGDWDAVLESVRHTIQMRLRTANVVANFLVLVAADDRIEVLTPEVSEPQIGQIRELATRPGTLEFALLANRTDHATEIAAASTASASESPDGAWVWIPVAAGVDDPREHGMVVFRDSEGADAAPREYLVIRGPAERRITGTGLQWARPGVAQGNPCLNTSCRRRLADG